MKRLINFLSSSFFQDRPRWSLWLPVFMALGITLHAQSWTPLFLGIGAALLIPLFLYTRSKDLCIALFIPLLGLALGYSSMQWHLHQNTTQPLLKKIYVKNLTGQILEIEDTSYGKRLLIQPDPWVAKKVGRNLHHSRLTHRIKKGDPLHIGARIQSSVVLTPFSGPLIPEGFDFRKNNQHKGIGASGYTVTPLKILEPPTRLAWSLFWEHQRNRLNGLLHQIPYSFTQSKAIASALITGKKGTLTEKTREVFAASGLAHILAISGLHMNLMALLIFALIKRTLSLSPTLLERIHLPKVSAFITFWALLGYLMISGQSVSAERAFLMASFVLWGILLDREGLSLHFVSLAACILLIIQPYVLGTPSFQMSFFVVTGLIAFYESYLSRQTAPTPGFIAKAWHGLKSLTLTSLIASIVILPFSIYHFHTLSLQGIVANLIVIPLLGTLILPGLIAGIFLKALVSWDMPLQGVYWILEKVYALSSWISNWPGAKLHVAHPSDSSFLLTLIGLLWLCLWRSRWRFLGIPLFITGLFFMLKTPPQACYTVPEKNTFVCLKNGTGYTNARRTNTFSIKYLAHALGLSETQLKKTTASKEELMKDL